VPIHFYGEFYFYHNTKSTSLSLTECVLTVEETRRSSLFSFLQRNCPANDGNSSSAQSRSARRST